MIALWIWKPWKSAYAGEKGKNLARKEGVKILAELRGSVRGIGIKRKTYRLTS